MEGVARIFEREIAGVHGAGAVREGGRVSVDESGKVDRRGLAEVEGEGNEEREYEAPEGEVERRLAGIWAEVLKVERVGRQDNFFDLGGHSLLAVRAISRIRHLLQLEIPIRDLFAHPVLSDFTRCAESARRALLPSIVAVERKQEIPLSFAQQRLWFLTQMKGVSQAYHISMHLHLQGHVDRIALRIALNRIVARHEALRTTFILAGDKPVQRILPIEKSDFLPA